MSKKIIVMQGESGSGKSTKARELVEQSSQATIRINRDDIRAMFHLQSGKRDLENVVVKTQTESAIAALSKGFNVIIDDTNLTAKGVGRWEEIAKQNKAGFELHTMQTSFEDCVKRDACREGKAFVGRAVIERQFLMSKRLKIDPHRKVVIVDMDGTVADHRGLRNPYDEHLVIWDKPFPVVVEWVRNLSKGDDRRTIIIVSGRHSTCGADTTDWLLYGDVPFDHIFMRHAWDNRSDVIVKQEILDEILGIIPKEQIDFVLDDRPSVVNGVWRKNGIKVYPVAGECEPF